MANASIERHFEQFLKAFYRLPRVRIFKTIGMAAHECRVFYATRDSSLISRQVEWVLRALPSPRTSPKGTNQVAPFGLGRREFFSETRLGNKDMSAPEGFFECRGMSLIRDALDQFL
jgi:hypothetical protein